MSGSTGVLPRSPLGGFVELRSHSWYSFGAGVSSPWELAARAADVGYDVVGLCDVDNLCGAMEFDIACRGAGVAPVFGADLSVVGELGGGAGGVLSLLVRDGGGYANLCRLVSLSHLRGGRLTPGLESAFVRDHCSGLVAVTGGPGSSLGLLLDRRDWSGASALLNLYVGLFGREWVRLEMQQHLRFGDTERNALLRDLAESARVGLIASNEPWYSEPGGRRIHDVLSALRMGVSLHEAGARLKPNGNYWLRSPDEMAGLFRSNGDAVAGARELAESCSDFSLDGWVRGRYRVPEPVLPPGYDADLWLEHLCRESAVRRYGSLNAEVLARLGRELDLIRHHGLAGFFLVYHRIVELAREEMLGLGYGDRETPLEWLPPGRGRGSSVAMLVGYLIGLSHVDPLAYGLSLDRFLSEETSSVPDIDLDFPRDIRERLILRVIEEWGWEHASLVGMFTTYRSRGVVRFLGKALGLPQGELEALSRRLEGGSVAELEDVGRRTGRNLEPAWRDFYALAPQLAGIPRGLAQHPGGMLVSGSPLLDLVPVQPAAMDGRYIVQWDKDSADDAGMLKIDLLGLGALSQLQEAVGIVRARTGSEPDLSRINYRDPEVFNDMSRADTVGVFQVESAAQMQTIVRLRPRDIYDLAIEVAAVRPGVGVEDGVSEYLRRRSGSDWDYTHPLEAGPLERTEGVIVFQDQVVQLGMSVAGMSPAEADRMRRSLGRKGGGDEIARYREVFVKGAMGRGVPRGAAEQIFGKFNAFYMFPEGHALAFAFTAYQMAWLRHYHPLEFYVGMFNQQPMGFWDVDTLKQDARRLGLEVLSPDVNFSQVKCVAEGERGLRLGLSAVTGISGSAAAGVVSARERGGEFVGVEDFLSRGGLGRDAVDALVASGGLDSLGEGRNRRELLWLTSVAPVVRGNRQMSLPLGFSGSVPELREDALRRVLDEYRVLGLSPGSHIMEFARAGLGDRVTTSADLVGVEEGRRVRVAGRVVRRQRPLSSAVYLTLEDEFGLAPVLVWEGDWWRLRRALSAQLVAVSGVVSRREGTLNVVAQKASALRLSPVGALPDGRPSWR